MLRQTDPEFIYYNSHAISTQNYSQGQKDDAVARISEDRTTAIIPDISKYDLSIVRFDAVGLKDIPIFIPMIETGQSDPNKTVYRCTMSVRISDGASGFQSFTATENLTFFPQLLGLEQPTPPILRPEYSNEYYYVYSIDHVSKLLDKLFFEVYNDLQQQIDNFANEPITLVPRPPQVQFDTNTKKYKIYFDKRGYGKTTVPSGSDAFFDIWFNSNLYNLVSNFSGYFNENIVEDTKYFKFDFYQHLGTQYETINSIEYIVMEQENESLQLWSPAANIVFTTDLIPSLSEQVNISNLSGTSIERVGNNNDTENILTDIALPLDNPFDVQNISYVPSAEYRMINLNNSAGRQLKNINFSLLWRNKYNGALVPVKLSGGSYFSVKLMFRHKSQR